MRTPGFTAGALALLATSASAKTVKVEVGARGGVTFTPDNIKAATGDIVEFNFLSDHDVVAGSFSEPCKEASKGGFYSGMLPNGDNKYFSITINSTDPIFFYCSVGDHCQVGMVGVINQGSDSLNDYKSAAESSSSSETPAKAFNGVVSDKSDSASSDSDSSPSKTDSASSSQTSDAAAEETSDNAAASLSGSVAAYLGLVVAGAMAL